MEGVIPVLMMVAVIVGWAWLLDRGSGGRLWSPLWMAFGATTIAILYIVAGIIGYTLSRNDRFIAGTPWIGGVIWWEIIVGISLGVVAAALWRKSIRSLRP